MLVTVAAALLVILLPLAAIVGLHVVGVRDSPLSRRAVDRVPDVVLEALALKGLRSDAASVSANWPTGLKITNWTIAAIGMLGLAGGWILAISFLLSELP